MLADEPVASLDPATSHSVMKYLEEINQQDGITVLCNLHFLSLARRYATRVIALKAGQIVFDGLPTEIDEDALPRDLRRGRRRGGDPLMERLDAQHGRRRRRHGDRCPAPRRQRTVPWTACVQGRAAARSSRPGATSSGSSCWWRRSAYGWKVTQVDFVSLMVDLPKAQRIFTGLMQPDVLSRRVTESVSASAPLRGRRIAGGQPTTASVGGGTLTVCARLDRPGGATDDRAERRPTRTAT